jgi:CHAT domain-containing protein
MTNCIKTFFIILILLITQLAFGQTLTLEDKIYNTVDTFVANPNEENLKKLESFSKNISTTAKNKNELMALVVLYCNKAYYENQFNKTGKAISSYETAWKIYQKNHLKDYDIVEFCLKPLGNLYTIIGDYDNAENTIKQYYYIATQQKNQQQQYAAVLNLSNVYQNSGRINEAIDLLEKTIRNEKLSNTQKGILYNNLGSNYFLTTKNFIMKFDAFDKTENSFSKAVSLLKKDTSQSETLANTYRNLSVLSLDRNDIKSANLYFQKAKLEFEKTPNNNPRKKAQFYFDEANILFKLGKLNQSSAIIAHTFKTLIPNYSSQKNILPNKNSLYTETILLDALDLQAEIYWRQNQSKKALESYALAFHIEELFQSLLVYENSKIIGQIRNRNRTEKCITIYQSLFEKEHKITYLEKAFQLAEQTKSAVLQQGINNSKTQSKAEKQLSEQLLNQNNLILKEQQKGDLADIVKINEAIKKQNELMLQLKQTQSKSENRSTQNINLNDLYAKLEKDNSILIEYFFGEHDIHSFTLSKKHISINTISLEDTATPRIGMFLKNFSDPNTIIDNPKLFNQEGNGIYKMFKLPKKSNHKNLIIIPDGILNFLPFEALITQESNTTNFAQMHYLLNDYNIGYQNSAQFYLAPSQNKKQQKETVLGIFPVFENTAYTLTYSKDELHSIQKNFKGKYFQNAAATFENFKKNANDYGILHLSTHASSGDIETPASIKFYNQEILYSELYHLNLNPDLVVLSACETGIGKLFKGEGSMSIARGFQFAGAQNLLFSLWKVNDYTTSVFMDSFYQNIKNGQSYLEANANAKRDFLKNPTISNAKKSPYYWSAFVYYGAIEKKENRLLYYTTIILGIVVAIALIWLLIRYKNEKSARNPKKGKI